MNYAILGEKGEIRIIIIYYSNSSIIIVYYYIMLSLYNYNFTKIPPPH